jgi:hypothetical protein
MVQPQLAVVHAQGRTNMNKLILAIAFATTAAATVPADAAPRIGPESAKLYRTSPGGTLQVGDQCWKPTDSGRGYGFWTSCENVFAFPAMRGRSQEVPVIENGGGTEGGGGGDGGGGGGGGGDR